jgi:hypothetical protein
VHPCYILYSFNTEKVYFSNSRKITKHRTDLLKKLIVTHLNENVHNFIDSCIIVIIRDYHWALGIHIVAYRSVAKQSLCKQLLLQGHSRNNWTTELSNQFLRNRSVNTPTTLGVLLEQCFLLDLSKEVIKKCSFENSQSSCGSSEQLLESWGGCEDGAKSLVWSVNQRETAWPRKLKNLHCVKSVARKRLV